jgi:hypothetical protein
MLRCGSRALTHTSGGGACRIDFVELNRGPRTRALWDFNRRPLHFPELYPTHSDPGKDVCHAIARTLRPPMPVARVPNPHVRGCWAIDLLLGKS